MPHAVLKPFSVHCGFQDRDLSKARGSPIATGIYMRGRSPTLRMETEPFVPRRDRVSILKWPLPISIIHRLCWWRNDLRYVMATYLDDERTDPRILSRASFQNQPQNQILHLNYQGPTDPRWLPLGNDHDRILPLSPDTEFRYLGTFISLSLSSKKQIQIINDAILSWRWRSTSKKIDPALLASTVTEHLLPKIELGLLYAYGITPEMCKAWTSTILHTSSKWRHGERDRKNPQQGSFLSSLRYSGSLSTHKNP